MLYFAFNAGTFSDAVMRVKNLVLIDSSAWIFALRKDGIEYIRRRVDRLLDEDRAATCGVVVCELLGGTKNKTEFDRLERDMTAPHKLDIDEAVWKEAAAINYKMAHARMTVPTIDCIIAATAITYDVLLAHSDEHLDRISKETNLRVESYVKIVRNLKGNG